MSAIDLDTWWRRRLAVHEASHSAVARACGLVVGTVTIADGHRGCATWTPQSVPVEVGALVDIAKPLELWPVGARQWLTVEMLVTLAGDLGARKVSPREVAEEVRLPGPAVQVVAAPAVTPEPALPPLAAPAVATALEVAEAQTLVAAPAKSDREVADELRHLAHGDDSRAAESWERYLSAQCAAIIERERAGIVRLAGLLERAGTVGGQRAAAALRGEPC